MKNSLHIRLAARPGYTHATQEISFCDSAISDYHKRMIISLIEMLMSIKVHSELTICLDSADQKSLKDIRMAVSRITMEEWMLMNRVSKSINDLFGSAVEQQIAFLLPFHTETEIARNLKMTTHNVHYYTRCIYEKTECCNRVELLIFLINHGGLDPGAWIDMK